MAELGENFNAKDVEPSKAFEVLPPGDYVAQIVKSDMQPTKNRSGEMLVLEWDILEGEYTGRKLFVRLNLRNPNPVAEEIARADLSAICHAVGKTSDVTQSEQLHCIPVLLKVKVKPAGPDKGGVQRDAQNEVKGYSKTGTAPAGHRPAARPVAAARTAPAVAAAHTPAADAAPVAGAAKTGPWARSRAAQAGA